MRLRKFTILVLTGVLIYSFVLSQEQKNSCNTAFNFVGEYDEAHSVKICTDSENIPFRYQIDLNMPVCDDTLCANVVLIVHWDLAGNYLGFDTILGNPLTKFDHIKFKSADYKKLDQILKNRNSMLRILNKEDLLDKSVKIKSKTVDAVTSATPQTIKKSVVEGAVYSSFTLWHFVNGPIKNRFKNYTLDIYSETISRKMLLSDNYETQLFAMGKWTDNDYDIHSELLLQVIKQSVPLIKANAIIKTPLPFENMEKNKQFVALFSILDDYSKSIFMNRLITEKSVATVFLPLIINNPKDFNKKQLTQIGNACEKFEIPNR